MKLGYIGIGLMGKPMTLRLLAAGHEVFVWNRSRAKLAPVLEKGAVEAASPADLANRVELVMMCVTDQQAAEAVLFGRDGIAGSGAKDLVVVDFSSIAPASARAFHERLKEKGIFLVDAPVSGGVPGAEQGTLAILGGGRAEDIERARPVIAHLAQNFTHLGGPGAGQVAKLCNQLIVGSSMAVIAEAVRLAEACGVDAARLHEALRGGFADSKPLQIFGPRMAKRAFEPSLGATSTMLKDLDNAAEVAREAGVPLPVSSAAAQMLRMNVARGAGEREISTLVELLGP